MCLEGNWPEGRPADAGCRLMSRQSCQWGWQGTFLPSPVPTLALPAATPLSRALGDERATAVPCTPS